MKKMRYKKTSGKHLNFIKLDWDDRKYALVAKVVTKDKVFSPVLMAKDPANNWHLCSQPDRRALTTIFYSKSVLILAKKAILLSDCVTRKNALDVVLSVMTDDEILMDWKRGFAYYRNGKTSFKRVSVDSYFLVDRNKLKGWNALDNIKYGGEDGEEYDEDGEEDGED